MMRPKTFVLIVAVLGLAGAPDVARAKDVQVNTYTSGRQRTPEVSSDADGDFVVVWQSEGSSGIDADGYSVQGQRFASDGSVRGGEFQVNTYTTSQQRGASVALDADGDFIVVWSSFGSAGTDTDGSSVHGRRYASDGSPRGDPFQINTYTTNGQGGARVAADADGDFVVTWTSRGSPDTDNSGYSVQGRLYASDGSPRTGQFQVNAYTTARQFRAAVSMADAGEFVVAWEFYGFYSGYIYYGIAARRFASDGTAIGDDFQINNITTANEQNPSVAATVAGDFVVVWNSHYGYDIHGQRFASDGSSVGDQLQISTYTTDDQLFPAVAAAADGGFVVAWRSNGSSGTDASSNSVQVRVFDSKGSAIGTERQVNTYTTSSQSGPEVAIDGAGNYLVVWTSEGSASNDSDGHSVQRTPVAPVFADGFESGDTSSWSQTTP